MAVVVPVVAVVVVGNVVVAACPLQAEQQLGGDAALLDRQQLGARPAGPLDPLAHKLQLVGVEPVGPADQHQIGGFELLVEQLLKIIEVVEAGVGGPLPLQGGGIAHHRSLGHRFAIHHRHHPMDPGAGADVGPGEGLHERFGQGQAAGFHHDAVEPVGGGQQGLHGGQEVVLDGAAEAAVGQLHQAALKLLLGAETAVAQQGAVDAHFAELVDDHRQPQSAVQQQVAQQGGLACAQKPGHDGDRQAPLGCWGHLRAPNHSMVRRCRSAPTAQFSGILPDELAVDLTATEAVGRGGPGAGVHPAGPDAESPLLRKVKHRIGEVGALDQRVGEPALHQHRVA